jgi:hypothetical protein
MATFTEVVSQAETEVKEVYKNKDRQQLLNDVESIIAELNGTGISWKAFQNYDADELSRMGWRLATLQASLTPYRIEAFRQIQIFDQYVKVMWAQARIDVKTSLSIDAAKKGEKAPTADDISAEVWRQVAKANLLKAFHVTEYEKLQSYRYSIPNILYRIEQRINFIVWDKSTTRFMKDSDDVEIPEIGKQAIDYGTTLD